MTEPDRLVVIRDGDGNYYLLPWQTLEETRVAYDTVDALERELGAEVSGYALSYFVGQLLSAADLQGEQQYARMFNPAHYYASVRLQKGREELGADWPTG